MATPTFPKTHCSTSKCAKTELLPTLNMLKVQFANAKFENINSAKTTFAEFKFANDEVATYDYDETTPNVHNPKYKTNIQTKP